MEKVHIRLATSLAFAASAHRVMVGKSQPDKTDPKRWVEFGEFSGHGLVRAEAGIAVGDRVFESGMAGSRLPSSAPKIVAEIDRETRTDFREWLITWAGMPHPRTGDPHPAVTLDPERFEHVLLAWAHEQTKGGETTASPADFAPGDIPLDCALPLADHLQAAGLLRMPPAPGPTVISLTAEGIAAAELAAAERSDQRRRAEGLRNGIVRWLWERDDAGLRADFHDFVWDRHCAFRGYFFGLHAVHREYMYLVEKGLVYERSPWWLAPRLTATGRDCAAYKGGNVHEQLNPQPTNGPTVNFNGHNSGNVAIGRDVTQTTDPVTVPGPAENTPAATATSSEIKAGKNAGFWEKLRAFAAGTSGLMALVATVVIAVFTVLMWLIMSR